MGPAPPVLSIPEHIIPVAYLCIGYPHEFTDTPFLERAGWAPRLPLADLVFYERWGQGEAPGWESIRRMLRDTK